MLGTKKRNGLRPVGEASGSPLGTPGRPPEHTQWLPPAAPVDLDPQREAVMDRLFAGVFASVGDQLLRADGPLAAEVWASGMLSVWSANGWAGDDGAGGIVGSLIRYAATDRTPEAAALLAAVAGVAPARLAQAAADAAYDLRCAGVRIPAWADMTGRAQPTEAWIGTDAYGDQDILILGFGYEGRGALPLEERHTLCVLVDHNEGGWAKDVYPAADLPVTVNRWRETEGNGIHLRQMSLSEAAGRLSDSLGGPPPAERGGNSPKTTRLADMWALLVARLETLPAPERAVPFIVDETARAQMVAEFLESPEAAPLLFDPQVTDVCRRLVDYRCDTEMAGTSDADPMRWSPTLVGRYLLDVVPLTAAGLDPIDLAVIPDVLLAWVRWAGRRRGVAANALGRTVAAVEACRVDFALVVSDAAMA